MSTKSLGKPLTAQLIFTKTKSDSLHNIKNLNLWGNDLEDLSLIEQMPSLEVVSLSVNRISSLRYFAGCAKLQELYLRKNCIGDLREIRYLGKLPVLKVLWLHDNPCAQVEDYRMSVIKYLPNLVKLDNSPVTPEEKAASMNFQSTLFGGEDNYRTEPQHNQSYNQQYKGNQQKWQRPYTAQSNSSKKQGSQSPASYYEQKPFQPQPQSQAQSQPQSQSHPQSQSQYQQQKNPKKMQKKPNPDYSLEKQRYDNSEQQMNRNQNILMAILSLMRELDSGSLEIVRREADRMLE